MEPLFFKAENNPDLELILPKTLTASMEPLFFKVENSGFNESWCRTFRLQWSRFFSKRKIKFEWCSFLFIGELQWSRFFSKRKMCPDTVFVRVTVSGLQWSRFFSKRKITGDADMRNQARGFNGAAFFQSGKSYQGRDCVCGLPLQWSRFFSKRKIGTAAKILSLIAFRFNGAAFFQSGK